MKLKKLEITGFKSFFEKASIHFPPGISAIVGPNGCGKSNIVDALRWVMGEQSSKQLRGKSMEDVIFSGANGKQPLNMAEVSLTLANDNGTAPEELKDFTEIMLTRRIYRSGESTYLLNKRPCRLKDIHNVFLGSGLGSKSYAVIQQGNIGAITDAGPEERRFFIEEAAGITRYKNRKNEALRKVQITKQNLLRVSDIIAEVKRQMDGLKRQARKAERYTKYQKRIQKLDILLALHYFDDYTRQIDETESLLRELKDTDLAHTTKLQKLDAAVEEIKIQRSQKDREISGQKSRKYETQRNIDRMETDLAHLKNEVTRLEDEISALESARKDLAEKNNNIGAEIRQVKNQNDSLEMDINNQKAALEGEQSASRKISDKLSALNLELETCKTRLMDLVAQEARYKNIYQNASNNRDSIKRRLKRADEEEVIAARKVTELQKNATKADEQVKSLQKQINDLNRQIESLQAQLAEKGSLLGRQVKRFQTLELERNRAKSKYTTLKKMEDNYEWYRDGVRAIMKHKDHTQDSNARQTTSGEFEEQEDSGIIGLMADVIEPAPSFETAVETVLGESLQYVLVKDLAAGLDSISYLQEQHAGRSGFIPVASVKGLEGKDQIAPETTKLLLNHVSVKSGFEKIAQALLGHVVVCDNIEEAIECYHRNGRFQTIVTKNGNIISHQGILIGGSQDNLAGILAKKQELKELESQIAQLNQEIKSADQDLKALESEVRELESNLQKRIESKNTTAQKETEAEKALYKATEDLKSARRYHEIVRLEQEQLTGEESDIDQEMTQSNQALTEIANAVKEAQASVSETSAKISAETSEMDKFRQRTVDLKLKLTSLNAQLESSNNTLRRLEDFQEDGIKRLEQLSEEIVQKNKRQAASKQKIEDYGQSLSARYNDMQQLVQMLESNEADYHAIDIKLKDNDSLISDIKGKQEKVLQKIRYLELEQSQRQLKRDNIANRLEERYHSPISKLRSEFTTASETTPSQTPSEENAPQTPVPEIPIEKWEQELERLKNTIARIEDVNLGAIKEYEQFKSRHDFLCEQRDDLLKAIEDLHKVIRKINRITQEKFLNTFNLINEKLGMVFPRLFEGGSAKLVLTEPNNPLETGVEFMIHPPGKKLTRLSLLSGGEKALSAIAFIFSIFLIKPASFCLMDEIDAPLDDANVYRFNELLKMIGEKSQIIMITHNKRSMEFADTLFGITMEKKGISRVVSVNLERPEDKRNLQAVETDMR